MSSFINIYYDIFSKDEINNMLMRFHLNENNLKKYRDTFILPLDNKDIPWFNKKYEPYINENTISWTQMVLWPEGSTQKLHIDDREKDTTLASITFLNDNFDGGELFFGEGTVIRPSTNKTIFFTGFELIHGVKKVINGDRYTIATWYKKSKKQ